MLIRVVMAVLLLFAIYVCAAWAESYLEEDLLVEAAAWVCAEIIVLAILVGIAKAF